jgi:hypothetical protein
MNHAIESLERDALQHLLQGDDPTLAILREQLKRATPKQREMSGVGFFTEFEMPDAVPRIAGDPSTRFGDVVADIEGLAHGVGFLLFVDAGKLTMLEAYTFGEPWPETVGHYNLRYLNGEGRDLTTLRQTPGWPNVT